MLLSSSVLIAHVAALAACSSSTPTQPERPPPQEARPSISDAAHGGTAHFYFLPPLVAAPEFEGTFDPTRSPTVEICTLGTAACDPVIAEFTKQTGPGSETVRVDTAAEHYIVNWHTKDFALEDGQIYRIRVLLEGQEAGHADIVAVSSGKELKNASTGDVIALKDGRTLPIKFRIEEGLDLDNVVPAVTPDTLPEWVYGDPNRRVSNSPVISGTFLDNMVLIYFESDATQSQRQAAVNAIDGEVVGGNRLFGDDGYYYVLIEDPYPDVTGKALLEAIELLDTMSQVRSASIEFVFTRDQLLHYRKPTDTLRWHEEDWQLKTDSAKGQNWSLERIDAPFGWGCGIGDSTLNIAVVGGGFHAVADLRPNINLAGSAGVGILPQSIHHGTSVAAIIGARGDNGEGIAGTMWRVDLHLYEAGLSISGRISGVGLYGAIKKAGQAGARVINLSVGLDTKDTAVVRNPGPNAPASDRVVARDLGEDLYDVLADLETSGYRPLVVISAGNGNRFGVGIDAFWSGFPIVEDSIPERVLVVAASDQQGVNDALARFSNFDDPADSLSLDVVEIAAPGEGVYTLFGTGAVDSLSGTSFAAPYVSGVAGLLASFDPSLTAEQIEDFILGGAAAGGRAAGGIPIVNAYESLRAVAAEKTGAPLCGNRVWAAGGDLYAQRTIGGMPDQLAETLGLAVAQVEVLHGGKIVRYLSLQESGPMIEAVEWDEATRKWGLLSSVPADFPELRGGTLASVFGRAHDQDTVGLQDTLAFIDASPVFETRWYVTEDTRQASVWIRPEGAADQQVGAITVNDLPGPVQETCIERDPDDHFCFLTIIETRAWFFRLSYPQFPGSSDDERLGFTTVSPIQVVRDSLAPWVPCGIDPTHECRELHVVQEHRSAIVSTIDLTGSGAAPVFVDSIRNEMVFWIGQGERGKDLVLGRGRWDITFQAHADTFHVTGSPFFGLVQNVDTCAIEYREQATFASSDSIPTEDPCQFGFFDGPSPGSGGGTIAPSVGIAGRPSLSVTSSAVEGAVTVPLPIIEPTPSGPVVLTP